MSRAMFSLVGYKQFTAIRPAQGHRDPQTGDWVQGEPQQFTIRANEGPLPGQEKLLLPESVRTSDSRKLMSRDLLRTTQEYNSQKADRVIIDGFEFEVHSVKKYTMGVRDHYEYAVVRAEQSAGL